MFDVMLTPAGLFWFGLLWVPLLAFRITRMRSLDEELAELLVKADGAR